MARHARVCSGLVKLDEEKAKAVPMPTWLKEKIKRIGRVNE